MESVRFVGLDVHKNSIAIGIAEAGRGEAQVLSTIPNDTAKLLRVLAKVGSKSQLMCCYEAGPTGYGLQRALAEAGIACSVVAPSLVPVRAGDRVKTDRRDAAKLAHFLRSGDLTPVHVPDEASEAIRDLVRARGDAKKAELAARHQLAKFLLRSGRRYEGKTQWTVAHLAWVRQQRFQQAAQQRVLEDYLTTVEEATRRVVRLTDAIPAVTESWKLRPLMQALRAFRGVDLVIAAVITSELGDLRRFASARDLMGYLGLVPSEHSSGERQRRGRLTRCGNGHVRRVLIEASWAYRHRPTRSAALLKRSAGVSEEVKEIAWRAQHRLNGRYHRLQARGKSRQTTIAALARELSGFIWAASRAPALLADAQ